MLNMDKCTMTALWCYKKVLKKFFNSSYPHCIAAFELSGLRYG